MADRKANWALSAQTKFHIQKYDGFEKIENPGRMRIGNSGFKYRHKFRS
jgi:hypothetical protein